MRARASKKARLAEAKILAGTETGLETDSPQKLWDEHISQRKPKLFHSKFKSGDWNTNAWLERFPEYLKEQAVQHRSHLFLMALLPVQLLDPFWTRELSS